MPRDAVTVELVVPAPPEVAFRVFTEEIDAWWRREPRFRWLTRGGTLCFQGGELVERVDDETFVVGPVHAWEPGVRLGFGWRAPSFAHDETTVVDITFEAHPGGSRLTLVHRGWSALGLDHPARMGGGDSPALQGIYGLYWGDLLNALRTRLRR